MTIRRLALSALLSLVLMPVAGAHAAEAAAGAPPRIGLVLAGGGARGLAHIGVIRYLEEQGIRVHAVAGTSMGSIIAGLYASGMNTADLENVARTLDWRYAFDDGTARDQLAFRRKQESFDFLVQAKLRIKDGKLGIPMGAVEGQHLNLLLHDLVAPVAGISDFDQLPIPFRAVASDIATGEAVVLSKGDLALAMRASMSIPGVFSPIDLDGRLLVDGGIAKNIPVDVVQGMGVDRLIVVDIGTPLMPREKIDNVLSLVGQLTTIMTRTNSEQQLALMREGDVLITPPLDAAGVETMSFDKAEDAMRIGYEAAVAMGPRLAAFAGGAPAGRTAARAASETPVIAAVSVETDAVVSKELLRNMVQQPLGAPLDRAQLEEDIADIYGLDGFSRVDYEVRPGPQGNELVLRARSNPSGINYLKLGMRWDQDSRGGSEFGLRASYRMKAINRLGAEWYSFGQLGGNSFFGTEFHQPLDVHRRFFASALYRYDHEQLHLSEDGDIFARFRLDKQVVELTPGVFLGNDAQLKLGAFVGTTTADPEIGSRFLSSRSDNDGGWFVELNYDTLDRPYFPGSGVRLVSRYSTTDESLGADTGYDAWRTLATASFSVGRNTFTAIGRWSELELDDDPLPLTVPAQTYTLGGFLNLSGYTTDALAGNYLGLAGLTYYRRLTEQSFLPVDMPVYAGASIEAGNTWLLRDNVDADDLIYAGSVFLGVDSPLGPLYLGLGVGEGRQYALYIKLGQLVD
jgi:NTE family protein